MFCRERKIFPLALINYITHSGGGFAREPGAKIRNLTMTELVESVNLTYSLFEPIQNGSLIFFSNF